MGNQILSYQFNFFNAVEKVSLTPNSMAILPKNTYKNYACERQPNDDCEIIWSNDDYYDYYNH